MSIKDVVTNALTGKDNETHDIVRIGLAVALVVGFALQIYVTVHTGKFDWLSYAGGVTSIITGSGVALKLKETTEPLPKS